MSGPLTVKKVIEARCGTDIACKVAIAKDTTLTAEIEAAIQGDGSKVCFTPETCIALFEGRLAPAASAPAPTPDAGITLTGLGAVAPGDVKPAETKPAEVKSTDSWYAGKSTERRGEVIFQFNPITQSYQTQRSPGKFKLFHYSLMYGHTFPWSKTMGAVNFGTKIRAGLELAIDGNRSVDGGASPETATSWMVSIPVELHPVYLDINIAENFILSPSVFLASRLPLAGSLKTGGQSDMLDRFERMDIKVGVDVEAVIAKHFVLGLQLGGWFFSDQKDLFGGAATEVLGGNSFFMNIYAGGTW